MKICGNQFFINEREKRSKVSEKEIKTVHAFITVGSVKEFGVDKEMTATMQ